MFKGITTKKSRIIFKFFDPRLLMVVLGFIVFTVSQADDRYSVEKLSVFGKKETLPTRPGSAHIISEKELEKFEFNDIHRVLRSVPGVNIQEEDGFGLRPNIGLRGGHPHRSKKVTLMEDGVLIAPAPYSAPAAYYFPQLSKISSVEVFKGVPSTAYGPNSIGGALNMVTRMNPAGLKLSGYYGNFNSSQINASLGIDTWGDLSFEYNRTHTTGFKELQNKDDTGFERQNLTARWDKSFANKDQNINLKFNWSSEVSNETYAGLTDTDFNSNPYQRYTATELDKMDWTHRQYFASYAISPTENLRTRVTLYQNDFARSWNKLVGFAGTDHLNPSPEIGEILNNPDFAANNFYYQVLRGDADSGVFADDRYVVDIGDNQRQFYSKGAQLNLEYELANFSWYHLFKFSYRVHTDGVSRFHESRYYNMVNGALERKTDRAPTITLLNQSQAEAKTAALTYETTWDQLTMQTILRHEDVDYRQENLATGQAIDSEDDILAPGLGLFHQTFNQTGFLFGVNKGYTPVGPGQASNVKPEEAINYELGVRYTGPMAMEFIGFYSYYSNLLGTCTQSGGCTVNQLDQSFNGGEADVFGAEFLLKKDFMAESFNVPVQLNLTYTQTKFQNAFTSDLNEWGKGEVAVGDPIPYIPDWQANLLVGFEWKKFKTYFNFNYLGEMADQAVADGRKTISSRFVMGLAMSYQIFETGKLKFRIDNITDEKYAVSRRPFGLRPGRPLMALVGFEYGFY